MEHIQKGFKNNMIRGGGVTRFCQFSEWGKPYFTNPQKEGTKISPVKNKNQHLSMKTYLNVQKTINNTYYALY